MLIDKNSILEVVHFTIFIVFGLFTLEICHLFLNSLLSNTFNSTRQCRKFLDHLLDWYPIHKYRIKDEFILRSIKLRKFVFDKGLIQLIGEKSCLFTTSIWQDTQKCCLCLLVFRKTWVSSLCFSIGGPRFFLRVVVTMISQRFVKLGILVYYKYSRKYGVRMTLVT